MEVINFEDKDLKVIKLTSGSYLIDNEYYDIESNYKELIVKNIDDIRIVTRNKFVDYYLNSNDEKLCVNEYQEKVQEFYNHTSFVKDGEDEPYWDDLDIEYSYKKFIRDHKPLYKTIQVVSDPIKVEIKRSIIDTDNKYITNCYCNGGKDYTLYEYNRPDACLSIVKEKFKDLEMEFAGNVHYEKTANTKIWGNSNHSYIEYVIAFGEYVFTNKWRNLSTKKGFLDEMISQYTSDKESLENEIQIKYNLHFKNSIDINPEKLYNNLKKLRTDMDFLGIKQKSLPDFRACNRKIDNIIEDLEKCLSK